MPHKNTPDYSAVGHQFRLLAAREFAATSGFPEIGNPLLLYPSFAEAFATLDDWWAYGPPEALDLWTVRCVAHDCIVQSDLLDGQIEMTRLPILWERYKHSGFVLGSCVEVILMKRGRLFQRTGRAGRATKFARSLIATVRAIRERENRR